MKEVTTCEDEGQLSSNSIKTPSQDHASWGSRKRGIDSGLAEGLNLKPRVERFALCPDGCSFWSDFSHPRRISRTDDTHRWLGPMTGPFWRLLPGLGEGFLFRSQLRKYKRT